MTKTMNDMHTKLLLAGALSMLAGCGGPGLGPDGRPSLGGQIDRTGRPAISTALIATFDPDDDSKGATKDAYNAAQPSSSATFQAGVEANLAIYDAADATCGNQLLAGETEEPGRYATLASILIDDRLYVHTERTTCGTYLGLEAEVVGAVAEGDGGCGGRTPADDVIERSYSVLAAGILAGVDDTITADDGAQTATFPFLGPPTP